ncbi:MAG: tetratricopeptide repeat protein [Sulfuricellaceae bacterium]
MLHDRLQDCGGEMIGFILSFVAAAISGIVSLIPVRVELLNELGVVARKIGHQKIAAILFTRATRRNPSYGTAFFNLGLTLNDLRDFDGAIASYAKSIRLKHREIDSETNLAAIDQSQGRLEDARARLERVLSREPANIVARMNMAFNRSCNGLRQEALAEIRSILAEQPDYAMAHFAASLELLRQGQWEEGWEEYEWRFVRSEQHKKADLTAPSTTAQLWKGEDLTGKHILLRAEQGIGDTIQFCRFATELHALGARVSLSVPPTLIGLITSIVGIQQVCALGKEKSLEPYEFWCPLLSVPHWLNVTEQSIPCRIPYLQVEDHIVTAWKKRLMRMGEGPKIGLVWFGNPLFPKNWARSFTLADYAPLAETACNFISLQCGSKAGEAAHPPRGMKLGQVSQWLTDFSQTAGAIANLDLVITVDTSVAHLAGALGCPVWTLLSSDADWRWLLNRSDTPWYPSMRLYRQATLGHWTPVIAEVVHDLCTLVASNGLTRAVKS